MTILLFHLLVRGTLLHAQNPYGLRIVSDTAVYNKIIAGNPVQRLISLQETIPHLRTRFYYATDNNFTHTVLYHRPVALSIVPMADALQKAAAILHKKGIGILLFDAYRPYHVTQKMWEIVPDDRYAANPAYGSDHNRGAAVDLTLYDLKTGKLLEMPTGFDNFTEKAHHDYNNLPAAAIRNRQLLLETMQTVGLKPLKTEWWHYALPDSKQYALLDIDFSYFR